MKRKDFIEEVKKELDTIKEKATPEEIAKLDFKSFDQNSALCCIYGQMTGLCDSERAKELMPKNYAFYSLSKNCDFDDEDFSKGNTSTALEKYLYFVDNKKHREIISYLKGKRKTINLNVI